MNMQPDREDLKEIANIFENPNLDSIQEIIFLDSFEKNEETAGLFIFKDQDEKINCIYFGYSYLTPENTNHWLPQAISPEASNRLIKGFNTEKEHKQVAHEFLDQEMEQYIENPQTNINRINVNEINFKGVLPSQEDLKELFNYFEDPALNDIKALVYMNSWEKFEAYEGLVVFINQEDELSIVEYNYDALDDENNRDWTAKVVSLEEAKSLIRSIEYNVANQKEEDIQSFSFKKKM